MKGFFLFAILTIPAFVSANSLHSLVFEFSPDTQTQLPDDGWVKLSFNVVNYGNKPLNIRFSALCTESSMELPHYPHRDKLKLNPDAGQNITVFMNEQCGSFENLPDGVYARKIQYKFIDLDTREELTFEQEYKIEVRRMNAETRKP